MKCVRGDGDGAIVTVRLTPRANRDGVDGLAELADGMAVLKARVRALPEDGAANEAVIRLLARTLDVPKSSLSLVSGATQRVKHIRVGLGPDEVAARLTAVIGA